MLPVIRDGRKIWGVKQLDQSSSKKLQIELQLLNFRRSILKSPSKKTFLGDSLDNFSRRGLS